MKIESGDFRVRPGAKVTLDKWPTSVKPYCGSKEAYQELRGTSCAPTTRRMKATGRQLSKKK